MMRGNRNAFAVALTLFLVVGAARTGAAQVAPPAAVTPASLVGVWEGAAQGGPNGDVLLRVELTYQDRKLAGVADSSMGRLQITEASLDDDKLNMSFDLQGVIGTMVGKVQGSRIEGTWEASGSSGTFSITKSGAVAGAAPSNAAAGDAISGTWEGEVIIGGQTLPFSMVVRLSGVSVTGEVTSEMGTAPLTSGAWKDGTLSLGFTYVDGAPVSMGGQLQGGKLVGVVDYNGGEEAGTWTASRK